MTTWNSKVFVSLKGVATRVNHELLVWSGEGSLLSKQGLESPDLLCFGDETIHQPYGLPQTFLALTKEFMIPINSFCYFSNPDGCIESFMHSWRVII